MALSVLPSPLSAAIHRARSRNRNASLQSMASSSSDSNSNSNSATQNKNTRIVTFLGKGGSGKTSAAVLASQFYASEGMRTCLVVHSQDPTAEHLIGCKIGNSPIQCGKNLSAIKLETSNLLLEPLDRLKKVDSRLNLTQGILEGIVGEELGVLPGMDSFAPALAIQKLTNFFSDEGINLKSEFDVIVYDGLSTEETLRFIGATERVRSYLKYTRDLAEKTDIGRLAAPSILKLAYDSARLLGKSSEGKSSTEIWNELENLLEKVSLWFANPKNLGCYIVADPTKQISIQTALRYWGCVIQAGASVSGAFGFAPNFSLFKEFSREFSPLPFSLLPCVPSNSTVEWGPVLDSMDGSVRETLRNGGKISCRSVSFDSKEKMVNLFMPGFDKSEIKLYQYRGGSELLVEAGDQRRVIKLPIGMNGRVAGAKFIDRNLIVKLK